MFDNSTKTRQTKNRSRAICSAIHRVYISVLTTIAKSQISNRLHRAIAHNVWIENSRCASQSTSEQRSCKYCSPCLLPQATDAMHLLHRPQRCRVERRHGHPPELLQRT
uniref:Uncharacterized protein n=1 Tax=Arundo donax TaxID=35708 RepID=A0A0A9HBU7_ARUDO